MKLKYQYWNHVLDKDFYMSDYIVPEESDNEPIERIFMFARSGFDVCSAYECLRRMRDSSSRSDKREYKYYVDKLTPELPELVELLEKKIERKIEKYNKFENKFRKEFMYPKPEIFCFAQDMEDTNET